MRGPIAATTLRLRDLMTISSRARYILWRAAPGSGRVMVRLRTGERLIIRRAPARDLDLAYEIFVADCYGLVPPSEIGAVREIVDLGANIGYSAAYWARRFPKAHIDAFEPHPGSRAMLAEMLAANGLGGRVTIHAEAVGNAAGKAILSDDFTCSSTVFGDRRGGIAVKVIDFFEFAGGRRIDLLKIDIEGGEYAILMDRRFDSLDVGAIVFEWHANDDSMNPELALFERLGDLGWILTHGPGGGIEGLRAGTVYARRGNEAAGCRPRAAGVFPRA